MRAAACATLLSFLTAASPRPAPAGIAEKAWAEAASFEAALVGVGESLRAQDRPRVWTSGPMDVFQDLGACHGVDARFFVQPPLREAVRMLESCMDALSYRYGVSIRAEGREFEVAQAGSPRSTIVIVVSGMVAGTQVLEEMEDSLALRQGRLLTYPTALIDRTTLRASSLQPVVDGCVRILVHSEIRDAGDFLGVYGGCLRSAQGQAIETVRGVKERGRSRVVVSSKADRETVSAMNGKVTVPSAEGELVIEVRAVPFSASRR